MGTVDAFNRANFYDGLIRVVDPDGREVVQFPARDYARHIAERIEPWTYLKFPYLRRWGGRASSTASTAASTCATPLSRLNVSDSLSTPMAQEHFERFYEAMGSSAAGTRREPVHHRLATHWARLIELLFAAERMVELARDPEITSREVRTHPHGPHQPERRRRLGRGPPRHAHPPLRGRRAGPHHPRQPHRRHDQQPRRHGHVASSARPSSSSAAAWSSSRACSTASRWRSASTIPACPAPPTRCPDTCPSRWSSARRTARSEHTSSAGRVNLGSMTDDLRATAS